MCGIVGAIGQRNLFFDTNDITKTLGHRGPDSIGIETIDLGGTPVLVGHSRLAIVDLSAAGAQPMYSHDRRWLVVYNGEIYNHQSLRDELTTPFRGHSDTETLVEALAAWGFEKTVRRLNGIFAFAACDLTTHTVHLARDPFGIKPLYYHHGPEGLSFGSEVGAIKRVAGRDFGVNRDAVQTFLALRFTPSPETLFEGISRLPPGSAIHYDCATAKLTERRYIQPTRGKFQGSLEDAVVAYHEVLGRAVKRQLLADVPLGIFLSGGVDSALIAALAREHTDDLTAFTVGFGDSHEECEIALAADTAKILGIPHESVLTDEKLSWDSIAPAISHVEEPLGTTSILPMWYLSKLAGTRVKAVLTGQGSDEPWGGYRRYQGVLLSDWLPKTRAWGVIWRAIAPFASNKEALERTLRSLTRKDEADRFMEIYAMFTKSEREALAGAASARNLATPLRGWLDWYDSERQRSSVERMMGVDCRMNLADDLLLYGDKISMAHSIEARVPILDLEVVEFIDSLPQDYRLAWRQSKIVHKRTAEKYLPRDIVNRPKLGFRVPVATWLRGPWRDKARELLLGDGKVRDLIDQPAIARVLEVHQSGRVNRERQLFALIGLAVWAEHNL